MRKTGANGLILLAFCVALAGCGGEEAKPSPPAESNEPAAGPVEAQVVVEASELHLMQQGERVDAISLVDSMLPASDEAESLGYHVQLDRDFDREGQRLISITPTNPMVPNQSKIDEAADKIYASIKAEFDAYCKQATINELEYQQARAEDARSAFQRLRGELSAFQDARRGLPQTDASRLERRKLDHQIENALQAQIAADKAVERLQKKIDRDRFTTLLRVR